MALPLSALVDTAYPRRLAERGHKVNGMTVMETEGSGGDPPEGPPVRCRLTILQAGERLENGRRLTQPQPTLIARFKDKEHGKFVPRQSDKLRVVSRELGEDVWMVEGRPQPIRKRHRMIGWTLTLKRTDEGKREK